MMPCPQATHSTGRGRPSPIADATWSHTSARIRPLWSTAGRCRPAPRRTPLSNLKKITFSDVRLKEITFRKTDGDHSASMKEITFRNTPAEVASRELAEGDHVRRWCRARVRLPTPGQTSHTTSRTVDTSHQGDPAVTCTNSTQTASWSTTGPRMVHGLVHARRRPFRHADGRPDAHRPQCRPPPACPPRADRRATRAAIPAGGQPSDNGDTESSLNNEDVAAFVARVVAAAPPLSPRQIQLLYDSLPPVEH
jgi:hypothetical protein